MVEAEAVSPPLTAEAKVKASGVVAEVNLGILQLRKGPVSTLL